MREHENNFETGPRKRRRIEWNLLYSTEYNSPLQLAGNKKLVLQDQFKLGRTDNQIIDDIIIEFSSSKSYNNFMAVPCNEFLEH